MGLTKERENQIKEIVKHFPTIQAEKRTDTRKPPELVDMKPYIKELLAEVEELRNDIKDWENDCNQDRLYIKQLIQERDFFHDKVQQLENK